jgi:hypothetical protein
LVSSVLEQYRLSDLIEWHQKRQLVVNPYFQRRAVWTTPARVFLIDTILRRLPMPKIFMRTRVDTKTKRSYREIVDGQQRLRAIFDFAEDKFALSNRAGDYAGLRYSDLDSDHQERFLSYSVAVDQLINATDDDVLDIFARINSYTVSLNPPELRHAKYQSEFKWAVNEAASEWSVLWERFKILSLRERFRMLDDSLMAEMFGVVLDGVSDGGQRNITRLYERYDEKPEEARRAREQVRSILSWIVENLSDALENSPLASPPQFLMLFAAVAHAQIGIPTGGIGVDAMPRRTKRALSDLDLVKANLSVIASVLELEEAPHGAFGAFWTASSATTHRIARRRTRFLMYWRALLPEPLSPA